MSATTTRSDVRERYEQDAPDQWVNYGDVNPEAHGGRWVRYDPDAGEWEVYETTQTATYDGDADPEDYGDQFVRVGYVQWRDIVTEDGDYTDSFESHVERFHKPNMDPLGAAVDGDLTGYVVDYAVERAEPHPYRDMRHEMDSYADLLDKLGIEPRESFNDDE